MTNDPLYIILKHNNTNLPNCRSNNIEGISGVVVEVRNGEKAVEENRGVV